MVRSSPRTRSRRRDPLLSPVERLLFEAGIKLGGLFHQYIGAPVTPRTARTLARAIEHAVALQPYVRAVRVRIRPTARRRGTGGLYAYQYLTADMLSATVTVADAGAAVTGTLAWVPALSYPLMRVSRVTRARGRASPGARPSAHT